MDLHNFERNSLRPLLISPLSGAHNYHARMSLTPPQNQKQKHPMFLELPK